MNKELALIIKNLSHHYFQAQSKLTVLDDVSCQFYKGEIVGLLGTSGSGKSTLLHLLGLLDQLQNGDVLYGKQSIKLFSEKERTQYRLAHIGFIYQFHYLLPEFTAHENIMVPMLVAGVKKKFAKDRALDLLEQVGLLERKLHKPAQLSGGEQQRIAIARALANNPKVILADEPTGNLDEETTQQVFSLFLSLVEKHNVTAIIATHNVDLAKKMNRSFHIINHKISEN